MTRFPTLFPESSKTGVETKASERIWEDMTDFRSKAAKIVQDATEAAAITTDPASFQPNFQKVRRTVMRATTRTENAGSLAKTPQPFVQRGQSREKAMSCYTMFRLLAPAVLLSIATGAQAQKSTRSDAANNSLSRVPVPGRSRRPRRR
jgi:cytochrome c556